MSPLIEYFEETSPPLVIGAMVAATMVVGYLFRKAWRLASWFTPRAHRRRRAIKRTVFQASLIPFPTPEDGRLLRVECPICTGRRHEPNGDFIHKVRKGVHYLYRKCRECDYPLRVACSDPTLGGPIQWGPVDVGVGWKVKKLWDTDMEDRLPVLEKKLAEDPRPPVLKEFLKGTETDYDQL
jgi:hypothetical protein